MAKRAEDDSHHPQKNGDGADAVDKESCIAARPRTGFVPHVTKPL
jgi:hypothetical protein